MRERMLPGLERVAANTNININISLDSSISIEPTSISLVPISP